MHRVGAGARTGREVFPIEANTYQGAKERQHCKSRRRKSRANHFIEGNVCSARIYAEAGAAHGKRHGIVIVLRGGEGYNRVYRAIVRIKRRGGIFVRAAKWGGRLKGHVGCLDQAGAKKRVGRKSADRVGSGRG